MVMDFAMFFSLDEFESLKNILFRFFCAMVIIDASFGVGGGHEFGLGIGPGRWSIRLHQG